MAATGAHASRQPTVSAAGQPGVAVDMPHPETEIPRSLLFGLLAFFTFAQLFFEGVRFGDAAPAHGLTLPLLEMSRHPSMLREDILHMLAPLQGSPFWSLVAWAGAELGSVFPLFLALHILARWWAALAIFRLSERLFGQPMAGVLAVALWLGYNDLWPGGIALHRDYLAHGDVALALLLWSVVLWSEARGEWGLWCGLAACVDAPLGVFTFLVLWCVAWCLPPVSRPFQWSPSSPASHGWRALRDRWRQSVAPRLRHGAEERLDIGLRPLGWWLLVMAPLVIFLASQMGRALSTQDVVTPAALLATALRLHTPHALLPLDEPQGAVWRLLALVAVGLWCWRRALRGSGARHAVAGAMLALSVFVALATWLLWRTPGGTLALFCPLRIAPLSVSLGLIAIARVLERAVARQGSGGLLAALLLVFGLVAVPAPSALMLVFGVLFIEVAGRADRERTDIALQESAAVSWRVWALGILVFGAALCAARPALALRLTGSPVAWATVAWMLVSLLAWLMTHSASRRRGQVTRHTLVRRWSNSPHGFDVGRFALLAFVLAFGWRARASSSWRLKQGHGALSSPQPAAWQAAQMAARNPRLVPRRAVFVSSEPGFRLLSRRAVFADADDLRFATAVPELRRQWQQRAEMVRPLWITSSATSTRSALVPHFTPRHLRRMQARGVTHLVEVTGRRWPRDRKWKSLLRPVYSNREWTIYALR